MRRYSQNNDNSYYAFLSTSGSSTSRNSSSQSTNRNAHYQYYDPRLRTQQHVQRTLFEYQFSGVSPNRSQHSLYGSGHYQPPSFLPELSTSTSDSVADLGEPISIFDDVRPLEHRRSIVPLPSSSSYIPPDPIRRPSVSDVRLATAQALRERLLTDIEQSINDIEREITSLERRPSGPRYIPPRFSPIAELENQDKSLFPSTINAVQSISLPIRRPVPIITSPTHKPTQKTSAHSTATTTKDRNSGGSQMWPNKPKRVYEVIPSLNDSRKTSRQSSVGGQHDQIKISEIQTPQSSAKPSEKHLSVSSIQFRGQYHYGPEADEIEILPNDPENSDSQPPHEDVKDENFYETLHTDQFIREPSANIKNRASVFVPEISEHNQTERQYSSEDLLPPKQNATNRPLSKTTTVHESVTPTQDLNSHSRASFIPRPPEDRIDRQTPPRIGSRSTVTSNKLYHKTTSDLINRNDPFHSDDIQQSRLSATTPFSTTDPQKKPPLLHVPMIHTKAVEPRSPSIPPADNNGNGLVAYFFSDFGNEGEGEEEILPVDQNNFAVPTGTEILADDDVRSSIMGPSQASLLILHSAHMPQQQQQQHASSMPSTKETNNERVEIEENEEIASRATNAEKKHISTATSILPSPSPSPRQVLPTSIIDDMQTQFTRNNSTSNDDHHRQSSTARLNMNVIDSNIEDDERRSNNSRLLRRSASSSKTSRRSSRIQSRTYENNDEQVEKNNEETYNTLSRSTTPLENIDNRSNQPPERIDSADQRIKSATRKILRSSSTASNHIRKDEETTPINSPTKMLFKNFDRENSIGRMSAFHEPTNTYGERVQSTSRTSIFHEQQNAFGQQSQPGSRTSMYRETSNAYGELPQPASRSSIHREPSNVLDEQFQSTSRTSMYHKLSNVPVERSKSNSRTSMHQEPQDFFGEQFERTSQTSMHQEPQDIFGEQFERTSQTSMYRDPPNVPIERSEPTSRRSMYRDLPNAPFEQFEPISRTSMHREPPNARVERSELSSQMSGYHQLANDPDEQPQPSNRTSPYREKSQLSFQRPTFRQTSPAPSEEALSNQQKFATPRPPSSRNQDVGPSFDIPVDDPLHDSMEDLHQTPTNKNEPHPFTVQSEHFLRNYSQTSPYDLNQRLPSGYSVSHPNDSRRNSATNSPLPVALYSPDIENSPQPTSRAVTPMRKNSITSIDLPPDPNVLLTTTDEPDPDDPTVINSTIHLQMSSMQRQKQQQEDTSVPDRNEPSPLLNIVPIQDFPSRLPSVELPSELLPTDEQTTHKPSSPNPSSPTDQIELKQNKESLPATPQNDIILPSISPFNQEPESPSYRTPSSLKNEQNHESTRHSPSLPYPARLEDLMGPTPSPFHTVDEHKQQEQSKHLLSVSSPIDRTENKNHHYPIQQSMSPKLESNRIQSPSHLPYPHQLSNHASVDGDNTHQQQLYTPSISPQNEIAISPDHADPNNNNPISTSPVNTIFDQHQYPKHTLAPPRIEPTFITQRQRNLSSDKSVSTPRSDQREADDDRSLYRNDIPLNSASIKSTKHPFPPLSSPPSRRIIVDEREMPTLTPSQQHSKLSLRLLPQEPKRKKFTNHPQSLPLASSSPILQNNNPNIPDMNTNEKHSEEKMKRRRRRVSFSSSIAHFQREERQFYTNWRERVAAILASKHRPNEKYSHIQSRVNSFANFEYQPKKIKVMPPKIKSHSKTNERSTFDENKFLKRKKFKVKKPKVRQDNEIKEQINDEQTSVQPPKDLPPQLFGRLWCLPDGTPTIFHESLEWNTQSKLRGYSFENFNYEPQRNEFKIFNKKPRWHSESKLAEILKDSPRIIHRRHRPLTLSLPNIPDRNEPNVYQQTTYQQTSYQQSIYEPPIYEKPFYQQSSHQQLGTERKIFDIQTNTQQQSETRIHHNNISDDSRHSDPPIFDEKLAWTAKSKLKNTIWQNIKYQPKKSKVQIFHKTVHWNSEPKIRTRSPSTIHPSRASTSNVQIFDEKLNWDAQAKVHCWSEIDLRQLTRKKSIFAQYHDPKWNDIVTARVDATNYQYPRVPNQVEIFSDRLLWTRTSELKDYVWENFDYKTHPRVHEANNQRQSRDTEQTPPNRPKWNTVSKTRSVNSVYNPKMLNSTQLRRGWDRDLRRKRVHKLPPLKRKREDLPAQLAIDAPPINGQLAIDYNYDHVSTIHEQTTSNGYVTTSSRRSSRALVPINHPSLYTDLELPMDTPRSQRPVQQEWYDEMNKSRLTHRTDTNQGINRPYRHSIDSIHQSNTPKDLPTFRSSTRNSQNSMMSGTLLDSTIRTNRTTEFRLLKDMDEHHQHSHTPSQSMPIEIRGFKLEGTQLSVPDHATIRPLSNVSYGASERVKSRRVYPWSSLHPHGTSSRNSSLVPIAEFRRPSLDTTINENQALIHEE